MQRAVPVVNNWHLARLYKRIGGDPVFAAAAAMLGLLWAPSDISTDDVAFLDGDGAPLDGRNRDVLHYDPLPPVHYVWSVTTYSAEPELFVANAIDNCSFGDRTAGAAYGADGSLEIFLQAEEPTDPTERANCFRASDGPFHLVTRHCSPRAEILTGHWVPPPVTTR